MRMPGWFVAVVVFVAGCGGGSSKADVAAGPGDARADVADLVAIPDVVADSSATDAAGETAADQTTGPDCDAIPTACGAVAQVDPIIGSGELGYRLGAVFVGAARPFGLVKVGPDTSDTVNGTNKLFHCTGYWYPDNQIDGFSHTHLHGTGAVDYGDLLVTARLGMTAESTTREGYTSKFNHADEVTAPGYYGVRLYPDKIDAELTATTRAAVHRYIFPAAPDATVLLDVSYTLPGCDCDEAHVTFDPESGELSGYKVARGALSGRFGGYTVYFHGRLSRLPDHWGTFEPGVLHAGETERTGPHAGAWFAFDTSADAQVELRLAISFVDAEGARLNFEQEVADRPFDEVYREAAAAWEEGFAPVEAAFDAPEQAVTFYTALYHTMLMPTLFNDVDGRYVGFDRGIHSVDGWEYYSDFSLWDTFRTPHPLYVLLWPERQRDMLRSMVAMKEQGGYLPKWALAMGYTNCMVGTSADLVVADSVLKGIDDFDVESAWEGMLETAHAKPEAGSGFSGRNGIEEYLALGYVPAEVKSGSVSRTQEFAYADYCIARMAEHLGDPDTAAAFDVRARNYQTLWDAQTGFFRARDAQGAFVEPFKPATWLDMYIEGDAWQYLWYAPHDPGGMAELMGGLEPFVERLTQFFQDSANEWNDIIPSPYYFHGNEPDIHTAFFFSYVGAPDQASKWMRWIVEKNYANAPAGLAGNDDAGTLSAWYVFAALGFYPITCRNDYALYAPLARTATVHLASGDLTVERVGEGDLLTDIRLDGEPLSQAVATHAALTGAGTLTFELGAAGREWDVVE